MTARPALRLNLGDPSEARLYYLPHVVAEARGFFAAEGVSVVLTGTREGGDTARGGQVPAVVDGRADLTIAGPMVTMKMREDGEAHLLAVSAAVSRNPWCLAAPSPRALRSPADLTGLRVLDIARITTATLALRWLLAAHGLADRVVVLPGSGGVERDIAAVAEGEADLAYHHLHALAPAVARRELAVVGDVAGWTGPIPWSAYLATPTGIAARRPDLEAFARAIGRALALVADETAAALAADVASAYPSLSPAEIALAITHYRAAGLWPATPAIPRDDVARFGQLLTETGWLSRAPVYDEIVDQTLAAERPR